MGSLAEPANRGSRHTQAESAGIFDRRESWKDTRKSNGAEWPPHELLAGACHRPGLFFLSCDHVDRRHNFCRRGMMYHVSGLGNTSQRAVWNLPVQMG